MDVRSFSDPPKNYQRRFALMIVGIVKVEPHRGSEGIHGSQQWLRGHDSVAVRERKGETEVTVGLATFCANPRVLLARSSCGNFRAWTDLCGYGRGPNIVLSSMFLWWWRWESVLAFGTLHENNHMRLPWPFRGHFVRTNWLLRPGFDISALSYLFSIIFHERVQCSVRKLDRKYLLLKQNVA
jgi:hypothetical protein